MSNAHSRRYSILLVAVTVGLVATIYIALEYIAIAANGDYVSACDIDTRFACTPVYVSRYGSAFGRPVAAVLSLLYFSMGAVLLTHYRSALDARSATSIYALASIALGLTAYQFVGSAFALKLICIPCLAVMVISAIVFGASATMASGSMKNFVKETLRGVFTRTGVFALVTVVAVVTLTFWWFPTHRWSKDGERTEPGPAATTRQALARWYLSRPRVNHAKLFSPDAVTLAKFNDYQCPPCASSYFEYRDVIASLESKFGDRFRFVRIDFPLDSKCNSLAARTLHPVACDAAVAARLAQGGTFEELERWLFTNQRTLTQEILWEKLAVLQGSGDGRSRYPAVIALVREDIELAKQLRVHATPTFFLDGVSIGAGVSPIDLATLADIATSRLAR